MAHTARIPFHQLAPKAFQSLITLSGAVRKDLLGHRLYDLVLLRVSQINGCAFCMDMHWSDLIKQDIDARHLNAVAGWREAPRFFGDRERAAFGWAEAVNAIPHRSPSDEEFEAMKRHFSDAQIASLTYAVGAIRSWNMLNASFHTPMPQEPYAVG